ncbi:hypothetical protein TSMEX_003613 [Taenia solium]|eukprot:TsM_000428200 transcript=TsM_000428200 gene=TsM_000428200
MERKRTLSSGSVAHGSMVGNLKGAFGLVACVVEAVVGELCCAAVALGGWILISFACFRSHPLLHDHLEKLVASAALGAFPLFHDHLEKLVASVGHH